MFRHTLHTYSTMAHCLITHYMLPQARSLLRFLVSRKGKGSASSVFASVLETKGTRGSDFAFDSLMIVYTDLGFVSDAIQCFRLVRKHEFKLPFQGCKYLLESMIRTSSPMVILGFYMEILEYGFPPNVFSFNILMNKFCREGQIKDAQKEFDEIGRRGLRATVQFQYFDQWVLQIREFRRKESRLDDANELFNEMCTRGLIPNGFIFTSLIDGMCKNGRTDLAIRMYRLFLKKGFEPDLVLYNSLINGVCKSGDLKRAKMLIAKMSFRSLKPDKFTYTILLDGFCKEGDMESALRIREKMVKEGIKLDDVALTALISGLCKEGRLMDTERALREMLNAGMKPDDATYTMIMDGFCKQGDVRMGFKVLKQMQSDGPVPGVVTYIVLMNGLCKQGQLRNANTLLNTMLDSGVVLDSITYNILLDGHCKKANPKDVSKLRSEMGLVADYASYSSLISQIGGASKHR
ncbi:putative pentatricopeptide repeat-containing protein [Hibiscus syriacus]|uniref:Pentatricopeptide repeat-containing protein n=1 Tax=Hibiscus syriacus TaxID=106335 RepID=A0A6A3ABX1_HIBSY|nr:putative pentatricopeptide repeat-containing protein [Hibiscus syriacus]